MPSIDRTCLQCSAPFQVRPSAAQKFCTAECANKGRRTRERKMCTFCGLREIPKGAKLFCSRECDTNSANKLRERVCIVCDTPFLRKRSEQLCCSIGCANRTKARVRPLCVCGKPTQRVGKRFCSVECRTNARRKKKAPCPTCGGAVLSRKATYCSAKCAAEARILPRTPCAHCGGKVARGNAKYCSKECFSAAHHQIRICPVCGINKCRYHRATCSVECADKLARRPRNPLYTDELIGRIREMRSAGIRNAKIAESVGLSKGQVAGLAERNRLPFIKPPKPPKIAKPKPVKVVSSPKPKHYAAPRRVPPPSPPKSIKPRAVPILLRELYQLGGRLYMDGLISASQRDDVAAITRAVRKETPGHPGFVVTTVASRGMTQEWR